MKRAMAWIGAGLTLVAVLAGLWWMQRPSPRLVDTKMAVASYQSAADDPGAVVLQSSMMGHGDEEPRAVVVSQSTRTVVVAMSYDRFVCNRCAVPASGHVGPVTVRLDAPLGSRTVIDQFTRKPVPDSRS